MQTAGRYELRRLIARGGAAEIFEAVERSAGGAQRKVAIKRLLPHLAEVEAEVKSFRDEARMIGRLDHPNLLKIYDFGEVDGLPFQALELVEGEDLEYFASMSASVPEAIALFVVSELCRALAISHDAGIIHRDVTPENILISWTGEVKLADFGIAFAKEREQRTALGLAKGKLEYMAPEQLRGEQADARADVFALGCVLHRMLAGASPLEDAAARDDVLSGKDPVLDAELAGDLKALLVSALRVDRDLRTSSVTELGEACRRALSARGRQDGRRMIEAWLEEIDTAMEPVSVRAARDLVDIDLVLERHEEGRSRFTSRAREQRPIATPETIEAGARIAGYLILGVLGRGSTATVFRAEHPERGDRFAIKIMHAKICGVPRLRRRFLREARLLASIAHPNIVKVLEAGEENGVLYSVSELIEGRPLSQVIVEEAPLSAKRAAELGAQLARGLADIHRLGIVHRDLKPPNVMIVREPDGSERIKLLDFGIARLIDPSSEETALTKGGLLGTPGYMAPEQIRDPTNAGAAADLYALGVIVFQMRTGKAPFSWPVPPKELLDAMSVPPRLAEHDPLAGIVAELLRPDPKDRWSDAAAIASALERAVIAPTTLAVENKPWRSNVMFGVMLGAVTLAALLTTVVLQDRPTARVENAVPRAPLPAAIPRAQEEGVRRELAAIENARRPAKRRREVAGERTVSDARKKAAAASAREPTDAVARKLEAHGLVLADLDATDAGRRWRARWQEAAQDQEEAELDALLRDVAAERAVRRLESLSRQIREHREVFSQSELDSFERRYFELRSSLDRGKANGAHAAHLELVKSLERDVELAISGAQR